MVTGVFCFADTFANGEKYVDKFLSKGNYIKVFQDESNTFYIPKNAVTSIQIDEDDLFIAVNGINFYTRKVTDSVVFSNKRYLIGNDDEGNLKITSKNYRK